MKKILAAIACIAAVAACSTAAFAADVEVGASDGANSQATVGDSNPGTGVILTVVPTALAAGALTVSGIVLKKKNK